MAIFDRQSLTSSSDYNTLICVAAGGASATIGFVVYKFRKHYDREKKGHYKPRRPSLIANAEKNNDTIYYFGVGSNMVSPLSVCLALDCHPRGVQMWVLTFRLHFYISLRFLVTFQGRRSSR
jgi:hypothetical protein